MTTSDPFGSAAPPGASGPAMKELAGKLLLVDIHAIERGIVIQGQKDPADAAKCNLVILDGGDAGTAHTNAALWGKVIVNQFTAGTKYVGRVIQGQATGSNNPPWVWQDGSDDDKAVAVRYLTHVNTQAVNTQAVNTQAAPAVQAADPWAATAPTTSAAPPWA